MATDRVTVMGLGLMGSALARAAMAAGLDVTVWNRSPARAQAFADGPARVAPTVEEAVDASDVSVVCVRDHDATNEALRTPAVEARLAGKAIVQLSTGTPVQARDAAGWAEGVGAEYLDGSRSWGSPRTSAPTAWSSSTAATVRPSTGSLRSPQHPASPLQEGR